MKNRRDILILAGLFAALIGFLIISPRLRPPDVDPSFPTTHSREPNGAQALLRWFGAIGYDARRLEYREFALSAEDDALFILNPSETITAAHADEMLRWVEDGGTLVLADDSTVAFGSRNDLLDKLEVSFEVYTETQTFDQPIQQAVPLQPVFTAPLVKTVRANTGRIVVAPDRDDLVTLVGAENAPVVAGLKQGRGYIYLSAATYPFTNQGLRDPDNGALVLNMLRRVPRGGRIQFDEYHLGYFEPPSTPSLVLGSPIGWGATYAVLATGLYLLLSGRRFGRPVPLKAETTRRSSAEYVTSMADLFQRGNKREYIARHYHDRFKRQLARRYGLNAQTDDATLVHEIGRFEPIDEAATLALLTRLHEAHSEAALIHAVAEAEEALVRFQRR